MKKLIMFLMVLAISVPALAIIYDPVPPMWGAAGNTGVWHFVDPAWSEPSCIFGTESYYLDIPGATWAYGVITTGSTADETLWGLLGIPEGGSYVTVHVQIAASAEIEDAAQTSLETRAQEAYPGAEPPFITEIFPELVNAGGGVYTLMGTLPRAGNAFYAGFYIEKNDLQLEGIIIDVITHDEETLEEGPARIMSCPVPVSAILVDPNVMLVYETDETEGDFTVSLMNEPPTGATITITVDPNGGGPSEDITLIGGSGVTGSITFDVNDSNWDEPHTICFKAIDDDIAEPPNLLEHQNILVSSSWPGHETDANFVGERVVTVDVEDNDQASILFAYGPARNYSTKIPVTVPVKIWEEPKKYGVIGWRRIWVKLQVPPLVDGDPCQPTSVKLNMELDGDIEGDNLPLTDPCLPYKDIDDPNGLIFTAANYDTYQFIKIWGNDDAVLQTEGASAEGEQYYSAALIVWVLHDGGDPRYTDLEREVQFNIEDNECGSFGILPLDIGNPNAFTDPNYRDSDGNPLPDCYVDIYDLIEFATQWLNCSYLQDPSCESYL